MMHALRGVHSVVMTKVIEELLKLVEMLHADAYSYLYFSYHLHIPSDLRFFFVSFSTLV